MNSYKITYIVGEGETEETWFRKRCERGLVERYGDPTGADPELAHTYEELKAKAEQDEAKERELEGGEA